MYNAGAQPLTPEITSWIINTNGSTGYGNYPSNVQQVQYSTDSVFVSCSCIPGYDIGPWTGNPNVPANQNFCFRITRHPQQNTGNPVNTPLGHIGVWSNGVSIFNAKDAMSYGGNGVWNQNALYFEGTSFDDCLGHPAPNGEYHHHVNPTCLYDDSNAIVHSPIIGYAFDGFPIYGAYGFANANGTGGIKRMESSYRMRNISDRTTLPDGTVLTAPDYGPAIGGMYALGAYIEDFDFDSTYGDLDEHNGRVCVTPDYPSGTYAYFVTIDSLLNPVFPYTLGLTYYGIVPGGNIGPGSGHNVPVAAVVTYNPTGVTDVFSSFDITAYPNPATDFISVNFSSSDFSSKQCQLYDETGAMIYQTDFTTEREIKIPMQNFSEGIYLVKISSAGGSVFSSRILKQ